MNKKTPTNKWLEFFQLGCFLKVCGIYLIYKPKSLLMALFFAQRLGMLTRPTEEIVVFDTTSINCEISARLFSAADRWSPRAWLQISSTGCTRAPLLQFIMHH